MSRLRLTFGALAAGALLLSAGCSSPSADPTSSPSAEPAAGDRLSVVATTNVWGDVVAQVGGDHVEVTSIISSAAIDPHSYEASAQDQLNLSKADLVVINGGGYDAFATTMLSSLSAAPAVIDAVEASGLEGAADADGHGDHDHGGHDHGGTFNEHIWYDLPTVAKVADAIAAELGRLDPTNADAYTANAATFTGEIDTLVARTSALSEGLHGTPVAMTEPVPGYLLDALGLVNQTPEAFAKAIENETDVPVTAMAQMLALFTDRKVSALVYNSQTTGPQTEKVLTAAKDAGIPVVSVTEILPEGKTYLTWMSANIDALATALSS
ncbi:MAG: zinc ABC transporter substrate-binding protein [Micrococcales bacterium]|nr:zinc ABC transporter substrate-binding protein [Micrococcales bacterium]